MVKKSESGMSGLWWVVMASLMVAGACGSDTESSIVQDLVSDRPSAADVGRTTETAELAFVEDLVETLEIVLTDAAGEVDIFVECQPGTGCFLDPCQEHSDCLHGPCLEFLGDKACSQTCFEECPPGFECKQIPGFEPDILFACVSPLATLCRPCLDSAGCAGPEGTPGLCLSYGSQGAFCGADCLQSDCPTGFSCTTAQTLDGAVVTQCVADAGVCVCSQTAVKQGLFTACQVQNEHGICTGKRTCTLQGLTPCDAAAPAAETCNGKDDDCDGQTDNAVCDDGNPCTEDACEPETGCQHTPLDTGGCDDENVCTLADHCSQGKCTGTLIDCNDDNLCTWDNCDPAGGCIYSYNSADCDDEDPCTVADQCKSGQCVGFAVECDCTDNIDCLALEDGNLCNGILYCDKDKVPYSCAVKQDTVIVCPPPAGLGAECLSPSCNSQTGECSLVPDHEGLACDDGDACTAGEKCAQGGCGAGTPVNCSDENPCTDDSCDPAVGCIQTDNQLPCSDGNVCTLGDQCLDGKCAPGNALACDDSNPCTDDSCDQATGCQHNPNLADCDDKDACSVGDHCKSGKCLPGGQQSCDDSNPCTDDWCHKATGCNHNNNSSPCEDGDVCTVMDTCKSGQCKPGQPVNCNDENICTDDSCDPESGCVHSHNTVVCNDGDVCSTQDICDQGVCQGVGVLDCNDGNLCTDDSCDEAAGCVHLPNEESCDDGNACTSVDQCLAGSCKGGAAPDCDDINPCTTDICLWDSGCAHFPLGVGAEVGLCQQCDGIGETTVPAKDDECGTLTCAGRYVSSGEQGPLATQTCYSREDMTPGECAGPGECAAPDSPACDSQPAGDLMYSCGVCAFLPDGACSGGTLGACAGYDQGTDTGVCRECDGQGAEQMTEDDEECGSIDCSGLNELFTQGEASATGTNYCISRQYPPITTGRCAQLGQCKTPDSLDCTQFSDVEVAVCGPCLYAQGACQECQAYPDETTCGPGLWCQSGACKPNPYGDGADGDLAVTEAGLVVNHYSHVTDEEAPAGALALTLADASEFAGGDEILILQVQHGDNAGVYEFAWIGQVDENTLQLTEGLANSYYSGAFDTPGAAAVQVVRVPHFKQVTVASGASITAPAWNGYSGGVVVFRAAQSVSVAGAVDVTGKGYRTGPITCCNCDGYQGEGWTGIGVVSTAENSGGGGGSTWSDCSGDSSAGGSGGGGYGEAGQTGNDCNNCGCGTDQGGEGGAPFGVADLSLLFFGGGAGSNGRDNNCTVGNGAPGSPGGGIIRLFTPELTVTGSIRADGGDNSASAGQDSTGPASGAGGSIRLTGASLLIGDKLVTSLPGAHGWTHWCCKAPVSGAIGRIRLDFETMVGNTSPIHYAP